MIQLFRNLISYRQLLFSLVRWQIAARYRQSLLGPLWAILQPVILMGLFTAISSFVKIPSDGIPYPIFSYAALLPWTFFSNCVVFSTPTMVANAAILRKIYFPREVFPAAAILTTLFDFGMASIVFIALMIIYHINPTITIILVPLLLFIQMILALSIGLIASALGVFRRDIIVAMPFVMQFWMYASPVIYPLSSVPERYKTLYMANPMVGIIESFRSVIILGKWPQWQTIVFPALFSILVLNLTYFIFKKLEKHFADII